MANLVIVESPAKATTIKGYLGSNYKVIASKGHIRDLPKSTLGIDVDNGFEPHYINIRGKGDVIKELKAEAKAANKIFLATDPDREGEAISWHIANQLGIPADKACRVTFNEITKAAVKEAIKKPRKINIELVNSQQARRILDRLVGFNLSQVLWKHVGSGLSGGRVQSVATRIITEREAEIRSFIPQEYWTIDAYLASDDGEPIKCRFYGDKNGKIKLENEGQSAGIEAAVKRGEFKVTSTKHFEKSRMPAPPFTTSTLQQEASRKLGFQSQKTMKVAQELYDGLNLGSEYGGVQGLITYMRTDSTRISEVATSAARELIANSWGEEYLPKAARVYKSKSNSQDAHEAIRPSSVAILPKNIKKMLTSDQFKLYRLIWERFIASQMSAAVLDNVSVEIENGEYIFKTAGQVVKFDGFLAVYDEEAEQLSSEDEHVDTTRLPKVRKNKVLSPVQIEKKQHFTEPPARYTEATLIKFLEENGIGRPSTYAPIISIIISRDYVRRDGKSLVGTNLGEITTEFMKAYFPEVVDYEFTAFMEEQLDSIEHSKNTINGVIGSFYGKFSSELSDIDKKHVPVAAKPTYDESEYECPRCSKKMIYKSGKFGKFLACPDYPTCRSTMTVDNEGHPIERKPKEIEYAGFKCEVCGAEMVVRSGRYGTFYACSNYPTCKFTKQKFSNIGLPCPKCGSEIVARHAKENVLFYSCSAYPECDFSSWDKPLSEKCPECGDGLFYRKTKNMVVCKRRGCSYRRENEADETNNE